MSWLLFGSKMRKGRVAEAAEFRCGLCLVSPSLSPLKRRRAGCQGCRCTPVTYPSPRDACTPDSDDLATQPRLKPGVPFPPAAPLLPGSCRNAQRRGTETFLQISFVLLTNFQSLFLEAHEIPLPPIHAHTCAQAHTTATWFSLGSRRQEDEEERPAWSQHPLDE